MMEYNCKIIELDDQPVITVRRTNPVENLPAFFGEVYGMMAHYLGELGEKPTGMPFAAYYNMDMSALDVEAGFPVASELPGKGEIKSGKIPAGKFAVVTYVGAYDKIGPEAYEALSDFVKQQGYEDTGIAYEYYLNDPNEGVVPETEIRYPLK